MKCFRLRSGAVRNRIRYGLLPLQKYKLDLSVEDVFGGKTNRSISFTTDSAPRFFLDFKTFQKYITLLTPEHTTLTYATENFPSVLVTICKLNPADMVREFSEYPSSVTNSAPDSAACASIVRDEIRCAKYWVYPELLPA